MRGPPRSPRLPLALPRGALPAALLIGCAEVTPALPAAVEPALPAAPPASAAPADRPAGYPMVRVPAGRFTQGASPSDGAQGTDEAQREVTLTRGFLLGATEVPQALWQEAMGSNPSHFPGPTRPVEQVSWCDAVDFANRLSAREGLAPAYEGV